MKTHPLKHATHFFKSLESPSVRTIRKTHLRSRLQTEMTLSVPGKMRAQGSIKESYSDHLHIDLIMIAGMSNVLGLVHTIFTRLKVCSFFIGTRIWNISTMSIPKYPDFNPR